MNFRDLSYIFLIKLSNFYADIMKTFYINFTHIFRYKNNAKKSIFREKLKINFEINLEKIKKNKTAKIKF